MSKRGQVEVKDEDTYMEAMVLVDEGPVSFSCKYEFVKRVTDPDLLSEKLLYYGERGIVCVVES